MNPYQSQLQNKKMMTLVGIYLAIIGNLMVSTTTATIHAHSLNNGYVRDKDDCVS